MFDSWTDEAARGQGLAAHASAALGRVLTAEGTSRLVAIVWTGNRSGNAAVRRAGYRDLGTVTTVLRSKRPAVRYRASRQPYS